MLSPATVSNFVALCRATAPATLRSATALFRKNSFEMMARGHSKSSAHVNQVDRIAADALAEGVEAIYRHLVDCELSEAPATDEDSRAQQMRSQFELMAGEWLSTLRDEAEQWRKRGGDQPAKRDPDLDVELQRLVSQYCQQIDLTVRQRSQNRQLAAMSFNFHAPVGAVQTGNNASAHVVQQDVGPAALQAAIKSVADAVGQMSTLPSEQKDALRQALSTLQLEAAKEKPNGITAIGLVNAMGAVIQTVPNVAPAWQTITTWAQMLRSAVGLQ